ncbi:MAG: hypothetical protein PHO37_02555 [Kiritimatiellae bacterium]|nr:hypothetical protein [Kiritimatiellia bacterium]
MSTNQAAFPTTDWGLLKNIRGKDPELLKNSFNNAVDITMFMIYFMIIKESIVCDQLM